MIGAEVGRHVPWLDQRDFDAEFADLALEGLHESLDSPFRRRVRAHAGIADLATDARQLEEAAALLGTQMRQYRASQLDRTDEVGVQRARQFLVAEFFRRSCESVAGVGEDHVDAAEFGERALDHGADLVGVGDIQPRRPDLFAEAICELDQRFWPAGRRGHTLACDEQLLGDRASDARIGSRDEPYFGHRRKPPMSTYPECSNCCEDFPSP